MELQGDLVNMHAVLQVPCKLVKDHTQMTSESWINRLKINSKHSVTVKKTLNRWLDQHYGTSLWLCLYHLQVTKVPKKLQNSGGGGDMEISLHMKQQDNNMSNSISSNWFSSVWSSCYYLCFHWFWSPDIFFHFQAKKLEPWSCL